MRAVSGRERLWTFGFLGALPVLLTALLLVTFATGANLAVDFHQSFWPAGRDVLHGMSPYPDPHAYVVAHGEAFVYPAPAALLFAVFALLPRGAADGVFTALTLLAVPLTLWVLGVRDWRVYGLVLLWPAVIVTWQTANVTTLLGLAAACAWRWRDRAVVAGAAVAVVVAMKVFLWPLGLWLLATRRFAAAAWALGVGLAVNVVAWAVLGFDEIGRYLQLMRALDNALGPKAYSLATIGTAGEALTAAVAVALVVTILRVDERRAMVLCVALALIASPLVWSHYFALLLVPLALAYPRLHPAWALPVVAWVPAVDPNTWQLALMLGIACAVVGACVRLRTSARLTGPAAATAGRSAGESC